MNEPSDQVISEPSFGPTTGAVSGWAGLIVAALVALWTAFHLHDRADVILLLAVVLAGVLIWAFMLRSRIGIKKDGVLLRNAFIDRLVPYGLIDEVLIRTVTVLFVGGRKYVGAGVGRTVREVVRRTVPVRNPEPAPLPGRLPRTHVPDYVQERIAERMRLATKGEGTVTTLYAWPEIAASSVLVLALAVTLLFF